ncbi:hypothetical protein ACEPAH_6874 [Sanghuangporus vaninii]
MSQTSTVLSWSQSQSQSQTQSQDQNKKYGPTGKSQVHSAGCIQDGQIVCACDKPAARKISRTARNPDRPFYHCANDLCKFWKWESELFGTGLFFPQGQPRNQAPESKSPLKQESPSASPPKSKAPVTTGPNSNQNGPQKTTLLSFFSSSKRSYAHMSTGGSHPVSKARQEMTDEERAAAKARRDESIRLALLEHGGEDDEDGHADADDEKEAHKERGDVNPGYESSDDESTGPAIKKTRFATAIKVEEDESTTLGSQSQSQSQTQVPSTPPRHFSVSFNTQLPTPSQTLDRRSTVTTSTGADLVIDDFYEAEGPPSPTSFIKAAQRAKERESLNALKDKEVHNSVSSLKSKVDKGKAREDLGKPTKGENVRLFSLYFFKLLLRLWSCFSTAFVFVQNLENNFDRTSPRFEVSDPGPSSQRASQERRHERAHDHDIERELKTESFALQLASTIIGTSSNIRTPTPTAVTDSKSQTNFSQNRSGTQSDERHFNVTTSQLPEPSQHSSQNSSKLSQQTRSSSPLRSALSEMAAQLTALQTALSIMATQQTTLETTLHDHTSESEKTTRKMKALEKSVLCKDREIGRLRMQVEELRRRNAELEAFQFIASFQTFSCVEPDVGIDHFILLPFLQARPKL